MLSMRGALRDKLRYGWFSARSLLQVYVGRSAAMGSTDFPGLHPGSERWQGFPPEEWHDCPGRPGLRRRILAVRTEDGRDLTIHNIRGEAEPTAGPVLLQHGTGVRANLFYGSPMPRSIVDVLVAEGYDVWLGNWRGSIDLPECDYTLDEVARFDHPALIAAVLRETGAQTLKAIVHCQGSTSFALACAGGLVPEVTDVVSNAVSFHVDVPRLSKLKLQVLVPVLAFGYKGLDPQWTLRPTALRARLLAAGARAIRRECHEPVCQMANFTYGVGGNILWDHANIDPPTHRWIAREFGWVPITFFQQISRCAAAGHLLAASGFDEIPEDVVASAPRNRPRWTFLAGSANRCFLPRSQERSFAWLDSLEPGRHALVEAPGLHAPRRLLRPRRRARRVRARRRAHCAELPTPGGVRVGGEGLLWKPQHSTRRLVSVASRPTVGCCGCAPTTSSWRSSGWATTTRSGPSTTAIASGCSPTRARCWAPRARTPRTSCRTSSCARTARCATTTGR